MDDGKVDCYGLLVLLIIFIERVHKKRLNTINEIVETENDYLSNLVTLNLVCNLLKESLNVKLIFSNPYL